MMKKCIYALVSLLLSAGLILSIPTITILVKNGFSAPKEKNLRITEVKRITMTPQKKEKEKTQRTPRKRLSPQMSTKSGPRFAMSLDAQGINGVGIELDMVAAQNTSAGSDDDGVDKRPELVGALDLTLPDALKNSETNASVRLQFCVDVAGRAYDIRAVDEVPSGKGLAQAGKEALLKVTFSPAMRRGQAVPFCGMEQPIEIKFRN